MNTFTLTPIAHIENGFPTKFGIPRQSGLAPHLPGRIVFEAPYRSPDCLRGLEGFSHIWLIWSFSENAEQNWTPTVRPPRLGGNKRVGVFATRSPFRPNGLGLSVVKLEGITTDPQLGSVLQVSGADLMNGTPIFDIKPYITTDRCPEAICGFQEDTAGYRLQVTDPRGLLSRVDSRLRQGLIEVLAQDPRPAYHDDPDRIYGIPFAGMDIRFRVEGQVLIVEEAEISPSSRITP